MVLHRESKSALTIYCLGHVVLHTVITLSNPIPSSSEQPLTFMLTSFFSFKVNTVLVWLVIRQSLNCPSVATPYVDQAESKLSHLPARLPSARIKSACLHAQPLNTMILTSTHHVSQEPSCRSS